MRWFAKAIDKGPDQQRIGQRANQSHSDISGIQIGHYQHIGTTLQS